MAEAWNTARASGQAGSSWGGGGGDGGGSPVPTTPGDGRTVSGRFQLSFSNDGRTAATPGAYSMDGGLRRMGTWMTSGSADGHSSSSPEARQAMVVQLHEAAAAEFIAQHGYLVDDLLGDELSSPAAAQRVRLPILLFYIVHLLQRCSTGLLFGMFHFRYVSALQMGLLMAMHALFITYLLAARPYASWLLFVADLLAYLCELTILAVAVMLQQSPGQVVVLGQVLITCYFVDVAVMIAPELVRISLLAWGWLKQRRMRQRVAWQQRRQQATVCVVVAASSWAAAPLAAGSRPRVLLLLLPGAASPAGQQQRQWGTLMATVCWVSGRPTVRQLQPTRPRQLR
jgi:hypothetical protein